MILKMALRNVLRQKRRTILTVLSLFGGFVLATVFIGWADGTYGQIIQEFTRNSFGHIQIHRDDYLEHPSIYKTLDHYNDLEKKVLSTQGVESCTPRLYAGTLVSLGEKTTGGRIIGIDPDKEDGTTSFARKIIRGKSLSGEARKEILLGKGMIPLLEASLGDNIILLSQAADGSIANDQYTLSGIVDSGDESADRFSLYLHLSDAQQFLALEGRCHEAVVTVKSLNRVMPVSERLRGQMEKEVSVSPWQEFARSFYNAMHADQEGMYYSLLVIIAVVAAGALNTILMSVLERRREYGLLKAMGTRPRQIVWLILSEANIMGFCAILSGALFGFLINLYLSRHGLHLSEPLSYGGMKISSMRTILNLKMFVIPALTIFISSVLVGVFPALMAARTEPARTMRMH